MTLPISRIRKIFPFLEMELHGVVYWLNLGTQQHRLSMMEGNGTFGALLKVIAGELKLLGHGVMDVLTLGIWEVAGTPIESAADGTKMSYEVSYDNDQRVNQVVAIKK